MAMLDKRLKRMEDRVIRVIPKDEQPDVSVTGRSSVRPPLPGQTPKKEKSLPTKKRSADEAFTQELSDWAQNRKQTNILDATALRNRDGENKLFIEGSECLPPQNIQEHLAEVFFDCLYGQSYLLLHRPSFLRKLKAGTVPPVLILAVCAISARFSTHPQVGTEPAFLRGEQWATPARRIVEQRHYEPNITILTTMLILGLHYFGTCEGGLSWSFGGQAMRMGYALQLHRELDHDPLGRNNQGTGKEGNNSKPPELSFTDREIRRRTMWACYLMDTFNSSGTERPSFLSEEYFQIQLPIKESHFQMEIPGPTEDLNGSVLLPQVPPSSSDPSYSSDPKSNMGVAAYNVRAVVLWKKIVKYLNLGGKELDPHPIWDPLSQFSSLQRQITSLKSTLPSDLTYTPENLSTHASDRLANQFILLHILLAQNTLFLHRFAIPTSPTARPHHLHPNMPRAFLTSSAESVLSSANFVSQLLSDSQGYTLTVPFAGYCAYAAATVHVWGIFSRNNSLEASSKENLRHNYKYLTRMKRYWGMFHYMAESVKDIYRCFADAATANKLPTHVSASLLGTQSPRSGLGTPTDLSRAGTPNPASTSDPAATPANRRMMFQYGDWFDKYPHGVRESEWESGQRPFKTESKTATSAVMSQRSDLQSVEEFFASLSPPSKADNNDSSTGGRTKKVPRRRGKSVAENTLKKPAEQAATKPPVGSRRNTINTTNAASISIPAAQTPSLDLGSATFDPVDFDITSPTLYSAPQFSSTSATFPFSHQQNDSSSHPFPYGSVLPHLDRQMVFDAYSNLAPSTHIHQNPSHFLSSANTNPWDAIDMNGYSFPDPLGSGHGGLGGGGGGNTGGLGMGSSAWFMPFNIDPPNFGGLSDSGSVTGGGYGVDEFAKVWGQMEGVEVDVPGTDNTGGDGQGGGHGQSGS